MSNLSKSVRMSAAIRNDIVNAMVKSWEQTQDTPLDPKAVEKQLGDMLYEDAYSKFSNSIKKCPQKMLFKSSEIKVVVSGVVKQYRMSETRPIEFENSYKQSVVGIYDQPTDFMLYLKDVKTGYENWSKKRQEFIEEIRTILSSVNTTGQLVTLWPEAEKYLPPYAADPSKGINLPALKTSRLNAMLGITE